MITTKAEGLFANEPERRGVTSLACHVSARDWSVHGGPGAGVGCPVHGGPGLVRGGGGAAWPRRRLHGRSGRARHSGPRGLGEPRKAHGRGWRVAANAARASVAAGDDRSDGVTRRRRRATPARPFARKVERERARGGHGRGRHLAAEFGRWFSLPETERRRRSTTAAPRLHAYGGGKDAAGA